MEKSNSPSPETTTGAGGTAAAPARESVPEQQDSDVREARVAELRQQVLNGTYEVEAAKLSAKIVERHLKK